MAYVAQLLPDAEQARILVKALRDYSDKVEREGSEDEAFKADAIRLSLLQQMNRQRK